MGDIFLKIYDKKEFRNWLDKNHDKHKKIGLILHKKHTGKSSPSHRELMDEAICYGWIDTTIKRLDENRFIRYFCRRSKNSTWSYNTLSYAKKLIEEGRMMPSGLVFYKEGLKKKPNDYGLERDSEIPRELKKALSKNKIAKKKFDSLSPSAKKVYFRGVLRAKLQETKNKRVNAVLKEILEHKKKENLKDI